MQDHSQRYAKQNQLIWKQHASSKGIELTSLQCTPTINIQHQGDIEIVCLNYDSIPTTMVPVEGWSEELVNKKRCFAFQAKEQTQGRGQHTNVWASPPGNVYLSFTIQIDQNLMHLLPIIASSAVIKTIKEVLPEEKVQCKWVNDIVIQELKVGGLLAKSVVMGSKIVAIFGIGVNINEAPLEGSGCLKKFAGKELSVPDFSKCLVSNLLKGLQKKEEFFKLYRESLMYIGQNVKIFDFSLQNLQHEGKFTGINEYGHAQLSQNGKEKTVTDGRMRPESFGSKPKQ